MFVSKFRIETPDIDRVVKNFHCVIPANAGIYHKESSLLVDSCIRRIDRYSRNDKHSRNDKVRGSTV